jgi:hypothetical protein
MQTTTQPWRDPTFFGFALFGAALLLSSVLCFAQARSEASAVAVAPAVRSTLVQPSWFAPATFGPVGSGRPLLRF